MKNPELFQSTVGILVNAYLNNTLRHGDCEACAVGNMISGNMGARAFDNGTSWYEAVRFKDEPTPVAHLQIKSTGYSIKELGRIEWAFEKTRNYQTTSDAEDEVARYEGLMAVVDVLSEIHEMNEESKQEAKALFVKTF